MAEEGVTHRIITPLWPQSNAEVEKFMSLLKIIAQAAFIEGKNWKRETPISFCIPKRPSLHYSRTTRRPNVSTKS